MIRSLSHRIDAIGDLRNLMTDDCRQTDEGLARTIGTRAVGLNIVNMVVGGGIFVMPGLIAAQLGAAAILAYLVCTVAVGLVFLCFAEVGSRVTRSGGAYAYIEEAFGPLAGFIALVLLWFGWSVLANAAITVKMVETLAKAFPVLNETTPRALFIVTLFACLATVNVVGVRFGVGLFVFNTIAKLIPLVLLALVGLFFIQLQNLAIETWPTVPTIGAGALYLFFAFAGAECALSCSGEIRDPAKTVPRGLLLGLGGILVLYLSLQTVAQGVLGPELAENTETPLAAAADQIFGSWGGKLLLAAGVVSIFSTVSGDILNSPRVVFASARDGHLPAALARVHPRFKTPYIAVIFVAVMIGGFALSGAFRPLAVVASGSILIVYLGVSLAVIRLRLRDGDPQAGEFRIPGGVVVPLLSCALIVWLLLQLKLDEAVGLVSLVGVGGVLFVVRSRFRPRSQRDDV